MGRKKKRNKSVANENTKISSPKSILKEAKSASPAALPKKSSQVATYVLCAIMFTAGVLAQKTFDRWKQRQDIAVKRAKQTEQGRVFDGRNTSSKF